MITEQQSFIYRYMAILWNKKDLSLVREVFAEDALIHSTMGESYGVETMEGALKCWHVAFPDMRLLLLDVFEQEDKVAIQWTACGTHQGVFMGIEATLLPVKCGGTSIYRLAKGKVVEYWAYVNLHDIAKQLQPEKSHASSLVL
jgi:predicted ester cyclase